MNGKIFFRLLIVFLIIVSLLFSFIYVWNIFLPFLFGYILSLSLKPFVHFFERRGLSHNKSVFSIFVLFFGLLFICIYRSFPILCSEVSRIYSNLPIYIHSISSSYISLQTVFSSNVFFKYIFQNSFENSSFLHSFLQSFFHSLLLYIPSLISNFALFLVIVPFVTFFLLFDEQLISKSFIRLVPNRYFEIIIDLLYSLENQFGLILRGMFFGVIIISFVSYIGLYVIGLDYPLVIGIISGVTNLIPYAGPIIGIFFAFLVALISGSQLTMYLYIIIIFIFVQLFDNIIVQPLIMAKSANLHPLFVLFLVLFGSSFGGVLGMLVIVPLASLSRVIFTAIYLEMKRPSRPDFSLFHDIDQCT